MLPQPVRLYFGHPVNVFNTPLEADLVQRISRAFPLHLIENPNQPLHEEGYQRLKSACGNGMKYYYEHVLPTCVGGVFLPFRDGAWSMGTYSEATWFLSHHLSVWRVSWDGVIMPLCDLKDQRVLSIEETRSRVRDADGATLPF